MGDSHQRFINLAEEIHQRIIEEAEGAEWWKDVGQLSTELELARRETGFGRTEWPAFLIVSVYKDLELFGIAAEFSEMLLRPIQDGTFNAYGVLLWQDPLVESCGEVGLWDVMPDKRRITWTDTKAQALNVLRKWIRAMSNFAETESPTTSEETDSPSARETEGIVFSDDFHSAIWFGEEYTFTTMQAACMKVMWENLERGTPTEHQLTILDKAGSAGERLRDVFTKGKHPAWETIILTGDTQGTFFLQPPQNPT